MELFLQTCEGLHHGACEAIEEIEDWTMGFSQCPEHNDEGKGDLSSAIFFKSSLDILSAHLSHSISMTY
jgi:hypothetical protein